ncbi:hypothetical protein BOX15_Mlig026181g2 [Macrostomum lignano]|uniref:Uncharacterized protein n=1 Tax=Macrostomum lignano TaxID=282301 RepID=A0A267FXM7_9PLAT|nr:hypothetical protein BOX15_Mlig026181g1 [Macrostomum lignano]PAA77712.1 hypothetical protein BOX15_Mlig026181g3 [Macrostomum lignano]PAA92690.1 hypothetical protein BOX15_Mlig026181g2 [Macrostomum lignano]
MPKFDVDKIHVKSMKVYYDNSTQTKVSEKPFLVQYESQHFRCKTTLTLEESVANSHWTVGLVQACDGMYLENRYGKFGSSHWEFHPMSARRHKMVNDSDGRQYPFYSLTTSKCEIPRGTVAESEVRLHYSDHFYPTVAWQLPFCGGVHLTDVIRKQDFWVWLVALRRQRSNNEQFHLGRDELFVLKTMRWRYTMHLQFDPHQRLGRRLKAVMDEQPELPIICETDKSVPLSAMHPPHCNAAQSLIWYPRVPGERQELLVPPKQSIVPWDVWADEMLPTGDRDRLRRPSNLRICPLWSDDFTIGVYRRTSRAGLATAASVTGPLAIASSSSAGNSAGLVTGNSSSGRTFLAPFGPRRKSNSVNKFI